MASTSFGDVVDRKPASISTQMQRAADETLSHIATRSASETSKSPSPDDKISIRQARKNQPYSDSSDEDEASSQSDQRMLQAGNGAVSVDNNRVPSSRTASSDDRSTTVSRAGQNQSASLNGDSKVTGSSPSAEVLGVLHQNDSHSGEHHSATKSAMQSHAFSKRKLPVHGKYCDAYRELLNEEIRSGASALRSDATNKFDFEPTTISASYWTSSQKQALFCAVALKGRDDLPYIGQVTGKSQPEVFDFISLLEQGVEQSLANPRKDSGYDFVQTPAAVEISSELEHSLETAADTLARLQYSHEVQMEKVRHEDDWLIDQNYLDRTMYEDENEADAGIDAATRKDHPQAEEDSRDQHSGLVNAANLLELSRSLFMHSADSDRDWQSYDENGPAIFRTAYEDLQNLTISITKRIVYTAMFQYSSRCKAGPFSARSAEGAKGISKQDVLAAVNILNLKSDGMDFWAKLPRRLGLTCYYQPRTRRSEKQGFQGKAYKVSARDAEAWLRGETPRALNNVEYATLSRILDETSAAGSSDGSDDSERSGSRGDADAEFNATAENDPYDVIGEQEINTDDQESEEFQASSNAVSVETDAGEDVDKRGNATSRTNEVSHKERREIQDVELAAEITDAAASSAEEIRLWKLLSIKPPVHLRAIARETIHLKNKARRQDIVEQHSDDWRQRTAFTSQWIRDQTVPTKQAFTGMAERRAKRELDVDSDEVEKPFWAKKQRKDVDEMPDRLQLGSVPSTSRSSTLESDLTDTASGDSEEDTENDEEQDGSRQGSVASRRSNTPRRASQVALQNLQESLEARSEMGRYMDSDDEYSLTQR